jgi:hypothetical protein
MTVQTMPIPLTITAFDPGGTTGYVTRYWVRDESKFRYKYGQLGPEDHQLDLWHLLQNHNPMIVVVESFQYRQDQSERHKIELISRNYIGEITTWAKLRKRQIVMQSPMAVMGRGGFFGKDNDGDEKLRRIGRGVPGGHKNRHARDAMRHLCHYEVFTLGRTELLLPLRGVRA